MRPSVFQVGGTLYWVIQTRNPDTMVLKDADSTPTVAVRKNGSSVGDSVTVTKRSATTGIYDCSYNPAGEVEGDSFTLEESATLTGTTTTSATYTQTWNARVIAVERGTDGANTTAPATPTNVSDAQTAILAKLPAALEGGRIAAELDSDARVKLDATQPDYAPATAAALAAAKTILDKVDSGLVADGPVFQFTANMLELGPSGTSVVTVLPATGIVANRSAGVTLLPVIGETISQAITVYQSDGTTAVNLSGKTLNIIFETMSGADVAVVQAADITISGTSSNVVTFAYPSTVTASERTLRFAIRDASAPKTMYLQGVCSVVRAPQVDA